jgi:serine/threonine protein kinase
LKVYTAVEAITQSITSLKSKQKGSKVAHEIFRTKDETLLKMKTRISELCNNGMMNGQISKFNRDPLGKAKELEIIARRTGKRRKIRGVSYFVLREKIFPCLQRIQNESQCTIYVEEGGDLDDTIIIEGGWRGLTLAEYLLRKVTGNTHLPQSNETNPAEREVRVPGKLRPGLVNISALDASKAWEGVEECLWDGKIGGKTCIPAQISRSALYEAELRWWVSPGYMPTLNGSMCNMVSIRRSFVSEDSRRVELSKIVRALEPLGYSQEKKTFSLLKLENDEQANDEENLNVAVSLQRWPREKTESTEKKGKGMGTGFSPAALQEMHLLHQLHFQIPSPQGHPNFVLPVAIAVEEEETQGEKEAIQAKTIPDLLSGSSDAVLAFVEKIGNFEPEKESRVELNGSHLLFKSTPLVLQRLIGKSKKGKGMKPGFVPSTIVTAWFHDLLSAVAHCHDNHVILRTLHADQIHIDSCGVAKISGLARTMVLHPKDRRKFLDPRDLLTKKKGKKSCNITKDDIASNQYMAPELILGSPRYTQESDVWALACLIIHLILGKSLFQGNKRESKMISIYKIVGTASKNNYPGALDYPYYDLCQPEKKYSPGNLEKAFRYNFKDGSSSPDSFSSILELLEKMLVLDPRKRISAANALKHPSMKDFLSSTNSDDFRNTFIEDWLS